MIANIIVGLLAILLSLLFKRNNMGFKMAMVVLTIFLSIRYHWGNDYNAYFLEFYDLNHSFSSILDTSHTNRSTHNELGWVAINRLIGLLKGGFFGLVICLTIIENYIIYRLISKFVHPNYYPVSLFFYVFGTSFFAIGASMMRQFTCICLYFIVFELMTEKRVKFYLFYSVFIIFLGATIHRSNIFMLLTLPLYFVNIKRSKWYVSIYVVLVSIYIIWTMWAPNYFVDIIADIVESSEDLTEYSSYLSQKGDVANSGLGIMFRYVLILFLFYAMPLLGEKEQTVVFFSIIPFFIYPLMSFVPMLSRFTYYFTYLSVILWPTLLHKLKKDKVILFFLLAGQCIMMTKGFFDFYSSKLWKEAFYTYQTIFDAPNWM